MFFVFSVFSKSLFSENKKNIYIYIFWLFFHYSKKSCSLCILLLFFVFPSYGFSSMVFWRARPQVERSGTMGFLARVWAMLWGFQWRCGLCCGIYGEDVSGALGFSMVVWTITVDWIGMGEEKERKKIWLGVSDKCDRRNEREKKKIFDWVWAVTIGMGEKKEEKNIWLNGIKKKVFGWRENGKM